MQLQEPLVKLQSMKQMYDYSELLRLPYFDIVWCHLVDPMHNLFLGTSKRIMSLWKKRGFLSNANFDAIQK